MIDEAGAAGAAAEPLTPSQGSGGAETQPDAGARQAEPAIDRSKETARASIDRAFDAVDKQKGDEKDALLDLDPDAVGKDDNAGKGRDERGRFTAKSSTDAKVARLDVDPEALGKPPAADKPAAPMDVPSRFSPDAKAAWAAIPDSVKAETNRALRELSDGLGQYQQVFEPLKPFYQLAQKFDTTVHETLERYVTLDFALLSQKPEERLGAIEKVLDYAGMTPKEYAAFIMGQKPDEAQSQNDATIRQLRQEIAGLKTQMGGVSQSLEKRREDETLKQVEAFAEENPRLKEPEFRKLVFRLLSTKMAEDLKGAYDMAERLSPAPVATGAPPAAGSNPANPKSGAAQPRNGNLSITGGPGSGSNPAKRKAPATARESVDSAFASLGLG